MGILRWSLCLLILAGALPGCSQTWGVRNAKNDDVKTVASVGDRSLPIISGQPGSSMRAETPEPEQPRTTGGRISGRVYDQKGKPVSNARVRLAVGGEPGGKAIFATTDKSGGFTLRGLRPGSSYTVIAEYQGPGGMLTGRLETEAPEANARISLRRRDSSADDERTTVRPARPSVAPVSNLEPADDEADTQLNPGPNREDLEPPAPEAEEVGRLDRENASHSPASRPGGAAHKAGWLQAGRAREGQGGAPRGKPRDDAHEPRTAQPDIEADDEGPNPLPPAIEPGGVGAADQEDDGITLAQGHSVSKEPRGRAGSRRLEPALTAQDMSGQSGNGETEAPRPLPDGVLPGSRSVRPGSYSPIGLPDFGSPSQSAPQGSSRRRSSDPDQASLGVPPDPARALPRPKWGELSVRAQTIPLDESIQKATTEIKQIRPTIAGATPRQAPTEKSRSVGVPQPRTLSATQTTGPACDFDATERRLIDFRLPDTSGKLVSFRELDADLILLDFWGSWCLPCRKSIPHLVGLHRELAAGKKLIVVGIASEYGSEKERTAAAAKAMKELGINYPVLLSSMNADCPVKEAMQVQFYPTMILLDRSGRLLWREQGATETTMARMDRFIGKNLSRSDLARGQQDARSLTR